MHKPRIYVISSVFHRFISHMSEFVFDVFGIIEIKRNRFSRLVMHVSGIVEGRRNVFRWRNTPAGPRNQRRGSQVMIFLQIWIFFENLYLRQTIYHYQCLGQAYAYAYAYAYCICICILQQEWRSRWSPLLLQSFTRSTSFLRFPSQHFNCCFNWSTVCSSGSLSSLEPWMTSPSVGKKCREVISAKRYWYQRTAADEGEDRLVHEGGGGGVTPPRLSQTRITTLLGLVAYMRSNSTHWSRSPSDGASVAINFLSEPFPEYRFINRIFFFCNAL